MRWSHCVQNENYDIDQMTRNARVRWNVLTRIRDGENKALQKNATSTVYSENESLASYNHKRKALCFETPKAPKKELSHIGSLSNVSWSKLG